MVDVNTAAGLYGTSFDLEDAVDRLNRRRVALDHVSIAGRTRPRNGVLSRLARSGIECDSPRLGAYWVAGPLADSIAASQRSAKGRCRSDDLAAGLERLGVSECRIQEYEEALAAGESVLFAHGSLEEISRAVEVLSDGAKVVRLHVDCRGEG
jgi:hypothetical protein